MISKEEVQKWAREEWNRLEKDKQDSCEHRRYGTLKDNIITCDQCGKVLTYEDDYYEDRPNFTSLVKR